MRRLDIPQLLQADLAELVKQAKDPNELLFVTRYTLPGGTPSMVMHSDIWLSRLTRQIALSAGVREVTPHGLRGTGMSLLYAKDKDSLPDIAAWAGHADGGQTAKRNYIGSEGHQRVPSAVDSLSASQTEGGAP